MRRLVITLVVLLPISASAETLRVPTDFDTIQEAVDAAQSGDLVLVTKGTHAPFVVVAMTGITIRGKGKAIVDATGQASPAATIQDCTDVVLERLTFRSPDDVSGAHGVLITGSTNVTVRTSTVEMIGDDGVRSWNSTGLLIEKCVFQGAGSDGIEFEEEDPDPATTASTIRKSKFFDIGDAGVDLSGDGHTIEKNRFEDMDFHAVKIEPGSTGNTVAKNKIKDTGSDAIKVRGDNNTIEKNKIKECGSHGLNIEGNDNLVMKNTAVNGAFDGVRARGERNGYENNRIKGFGDGFDIEAIDSEFISNRVSACNANGIEIGSQSNPATGNVLEGNKLSKSAENGLYVHDASANTFRGNKAKKSGGFDLLDETVEGSNTYEDNKFGTQSGPQPES